MKLFLFGGSKGGCGRTTTSLLCAMGLALRRLRVAHMQILDPGREGIQISRTAPFASMSSLCVDDCTARLKEEVRAQALLKDVLVIDLPAGAHAEIAAECADATLFLPVRAGALDRAVLQRDLGGLFEQSHSQSQRLRGVAGVHVVPIGFSEKDFLRLQGSITAPNIANLCAAFSVFEPGVPYLDPLDLHLWVGGGEFFPNNQERFYAMELADSVWRCAEMQI